MEKKDIENRQDIERLVRAFYAKVQADPVIGYIFNDLAQVNWERHFPVMFDFWKTPFFIPAVMPAIPYKAIAGSTRKYCSNPNISTAGSSFF